MSEKNLRSSGSNETERAHRIETAIALLGEIAPDVSLEEVGLHWLKGLPAGFQPLDVFTEMARINTVGAVEMVPVRTSESGATQVYLTPRPTQPHPKTGLVDPWAGLYHAPGTIMVANDKVEHGHDLEGPFGRLLGEGGELKVGGVRTVGDPQYVDWERRQTRRGHEIAIVHYVEVEQLAGSAAVGAFFDLADFPHNVPEPGVIPHHVGFVALAAKQYEADKRQA